MNWIYPGGVFAYISPMESDMGFHEMKALLEWQLEMGVSEAICDTPIDRYALAEKAPGNSKRSKTGVAAIKVVEPEIDEASEARKAAKNASDLPALYAALSAFEFCDLKKGARNTVFADGNPAAHVMIIGEAPDREENIQGAPFVGPAGLLLDKMLTAIGLSRTGDTPETAAYLTSATPWRPGQSGETSPEDLAMLIPFLTRHIELVGPKVLILMGNTPCQALLAKGGITRLRGTWGEVQKIPTLPMFHPSYLMRNPAAKRDAWADLLDLQAKLRTL